MAAGNRDERRLELKVGAMILAALIILVVFVLIISDFSFAKTEEVDIYFQNPGGLSAGVAVKVAGRKVGKVTEMTYMGQSGPVNPLTGRPCLVRVRMELEKTVFDSLREDAHFYITTKGVLGDPFLEIDPGVSESPVKKSKKLFGTDPPRLDLFLADAAELVRALNRLLVTNADSLDQLIKGSANLVTAVDTFVQSGDEVGESKQRFGRILENVEQITADTRVLVQNVNEKYVDNPDVVKTIKNLRSVSGKLDRELEPLMTDVRETMAVLNRLGNTVGPEEQKAIKESLARLNQVTQRADSALVRVNAMIGRLQNGEGTVGQLLQDEEIYDDLKELLRDIKHHPWKLIWED
ncbi:MAG: MCE family protein [Deltaproteobacteria bacterium]|nr:MCE family protein [Deltaproteobacteria bacterium]MBN2673223.1 MCE family protein [Deltaproteobacteria bacterium]